MEPTEAKQLHAARALLASLFPASVVDQLTDDQAHAAAGLYRQLSDVVWGSVAHA